MKPPSNRTKKEITKLKSTFLKFDFFSDFLEKNGTSNLLDLMKYCYYE